MKSKVCRKEGRVFDSWRKNKKKVVCVDGKLIHFGDKRYKHNYSEQAQKNYMKRSAGIKNKKGELTKDKKDSANYWSRKILWRRNGK